MKGLRIIVSTQQSDSDDPSPSSDSVAHSQSRHFGLKRFSAFKKSPAIRQTASFVTVLAHQANTLQTPMISLGRRLGVLDMKRCVVHAAFLLLMLVIVLHGQASSGADRTSLLYTLVSGAEMAEGPLDPSAYAQTDAPGVGGARVAAVDAESSVDIITFDDPEVEFASTLGGTAVKAPANPLAAEPGSNEQDERRVPKQQIYTVQSGDTIASIAAQYDISQNTVLWANGLSSNHSLKVGDHLTILPTTGVLHTVKSGETVSGLASKYDAKAAEISEFNGLQNDKLAIGQKIIIPDGDGSVNIPAPRRYIAQNEPAQSGTELEEAPPLDAPVTTAGVLWPVPGSTHISQSFHRWHTGIDIDNRSRPAVVAALPGTVEFAGWLGGYGNLIILSHGNGKQTYYAHLDKFYVGKGTAVAKGQSVGKMGNTGRSTGPHLHFEYRINGRPVNPKAVL